jgi:hypothetical protein
MAKCAACGTNNPETASFCIKCGAPQGKGSSSEALGREFERDALAGVSKDKITFICELCGTVNSIDNPRCSHCGKPRPRSEFVSALRRIKEAPVPEAAPVVPVGPAASEPENVEPAAPLSYYRFEPDKFEQTHPVVQPFVIVPYVNTLQQVWQYNPANIYKFVEEKPEVCEPENLAALKDKKTGELLKLKSAEESPKDRSKGVRAASLISLVISAALIICMFLVAVSKAGEFTGMNIILSLGNVIKGAFNVDPGFSSPIEYLGIRSFYLPLGFIITILLSIVSIGLSLASLVGGKKKHTPVVLPIIIFVFAIVALAGLMFAEGFGFDAASFLPTLSAGAYLLAALPLAGIVVGGLTPKN